MQHPGPGKTGPGKFIVIGTLPNGPAGRRFSARNGTAKKYKTRVRTHMV